MSAGERNFPKISAREYIAIERNSTWKHERVGGSVFAMVRNSQRHDQIVLNGSAELLARTRPKCLVHSFGPIVRSGEVEDPDFYHPDLMVADTNDGLTENDIIARPRVIIEVASTATEAADRGYKFDAYGAIASLSEYAIVSEVRRRVEIYRRCTDWTQETYENDARIAFESLQETLPLPSFYQRVRF